MSLCDMGKNVMNTVDGFDPLTKQDLEDFAKHVDKSFDDAYRQLELTHGMVMNPITARPLYTLPKTDAGVLYGVKIRIVEDDAMPEGQIAMMDNNGNLIGIMDINKKK